MYEDDPQDTVFDVLGEAVFGGHPLGRPIIGRAPVIRDTPVDAISAFHARRYVPRSVVVAAAGSVDHDQIVELAEQHARRPRARARPRPCPTRRRRSCAAPCASTARTPSSATSASARPACSAATSAASRCACSTRSSAACPPRGCSRPCARSAGSPTRSTRSTASSPTRARSASTSARGPDNLRQAMQVVRDELGRLRESPGLRGRAGRGRARTSRRAIVLGMESTGARMNRLGASLLYDLPILETDEIMERIDAVTLDDLKRADRRAVGARAAVRGRHRPRRGRVPRGRGGGDPRRRGAPA